MPNAALARTGREEATVQGIIIDTRPYRESDLILTLMTEDFGKVRCIARSGRNSKKRFGSGLDLFDRGHFIIQGNFSELCSLKGSLGGSPLAGLRLSLERLACASLVCEAAAHLNFEGEDHSQQFDILNMTLQAINESVSSRDMLRACYLCIAKLCEWCGISDPSQDSEPSAHGLRRLCERIEDFTSKQLLSRSAVEDVIKSVKSKTS